MMIGKTIAIALLVGGVMYLPETIRRVIVGTTLVVCGVVAFFYYDVDRDLVRVLREAPTTLESMTTSEE